jgi:hypothetical protein
MISTLDRQTAVDLINEAVVAGARHFKACGVLQISERTFWRWTKGGVVRSDQRPLVQRPEPAKKLSETERVGLCQTPCLMQTWSSCCFPIAQAKRVAAFLNRTGPTFADAILDRLVHNAYRVELDGESMRKTKLKTGDESAQNC